LRLVYLYTCRMCSNNLEGIEANLIFESSHVFTGSYKDYSDSTYWSGTGLVDHGLVCELLNWML
jgi:hypothetical protein